MMAYVWYRLRTHIFQWSFIYKIFGYLLAAFLIMNLDVISSFASTQSSQFQLQVSPSATELLSLDGFYPLTDTSKTYLSKENGEWVLYVKGEMNSEYLAWLKESLARLDCDEEYSVFINKFNNANVRVVFDYQEGLTTMIQIFVTLVFFLMIMKSINMVHEWLEESQSRFTDVLVLSLGHKQHLFAKTLSCFFDGLFDLGLGVLCGAIVFGLRWTNGNLSSWVEYMESARWPVTYFMNWCSESWWKVLLGIVSLSLSTLLIQLVIVWALSRIKESAQAMNYTLPIYLLVLVTYYMSCCVSSSSTLYMVMKWLPMYTGLCQSLYLDLSSWIELCLSIGLSLAYLYIGRIVFGKSYEGWMKS